MINVQIRRHFQIPAPTSRSGWRPLWWRLTGCLRWVTRVIGARLVPTGSHPRPAVGRG